MNQLAVLFQRFTPRQKFIIAAVSAAALTALILLVTVFNKPSYGILFSNLNEQDASKIVQSLKEKSVPYSLEDGGKTILVPKQQLYELRLDLASSGLPNQSLIGYEIFDRTNFGVSDFVQKVNYRRALEGELSRTILNLDEVEGVRVHIVSPEKALFKEDEKPTTASVVLKLKTGKPLRRDAAQGIAHLVASSVEGLESENVTILDTRGNILSETNRQNSLASLTSTQYELQQKVETYLASKAQSMLNSALGMGNSVVQVNAELDFRRVERNSELYDPEKTAVRSEQTSEDKSVLRDSLPPSTHSNSVTNYEVNKTVEHIIENVGNVKRLSIAAMVNDKSVTKEVNGEKSTEYKPRDPQEMSQLEEIVKKAVGFDSQRNDDISVVNVSFREDTNDGLLTNNTTNDNMQNLIVKIVLALAMITAIVIVRSLLNKVKFKVQVRNSQWSDDVDQDVNESGALKGKTLHLPPVEEEISEEVLLKTQRKEQIADYIKKNTDDATRLIKVWLADDVQV
ncbi:MAG: flagellar M-ring protein FliF [Bacteroidetes bacterium]|nr:flagellar M-ring protein FliF [Bacteroidota bacterium]